VNLEGKSALVTGGSRGIGRAIALRLAQAGANVAINYSTQKESALEVVEEIKQLGVNSLALQADISQTDQVKKMASQLLEEWGRSDILVNNAGIRHDSLLPRMSDETWDEVMAVDLRGVFLCTREFIRSMLRQRWGRVVNISSGIAFTGNIGQANYAAAKAGVLGFTRAMAREVATRNITVNSVLPGYVETDIVSDLTQEMRDLILAHIPMNRFGTPAEIAGMVAFLCTEEASYITGQSLCVDGGITL
jgi:3-oxoacyl-[acyl-carrier protein] reductase